MKPDRSADDVRYMERAIELSRQGFPAPNPHVGCVLVKDGRIVGEGFHRHAGGPHAEIEAMMVAGDLTRGSTAYVTQEPCNNYGRTPPCSDALIKAGVARVFVACLDPNPKMAGGLEKLSQAGIEVVSGFMEEQAAPWNVRFLTAMRLKRPHVVLKAAASLDGRIALPSGESKWITGEEARQAGHRLRAECGAVLVGRRTVEVDDPLLTARIPGVVNQPTRIVFDPSARLDRSFKVFDGSAPTLHIVDGFLGLRAGPGGFDLRALLGELFKGGITGLLVEGGAKTAAAFLAADLVDRIELFMAPKLLGDGPTWVEGLHLGSLAQAPHFRFRSIRNLSGDLQISLDSDLGNFTDVNMNREV